MFPFEIKNTTLKSIFRTYSEREPFSNFNTEGSPTSIVFRTSVGYIRFYVDGMITISGRWDTSAKNIGPSMMNNIYKALYICMAVDDRLVSDRIAAILDKYRIKGNYSQQYQDDEIKTCLGEEFEIMVKAFTSIENYANTGLGDHVISTVKRYNEEKIKGKIDECRGYILDNYHVLYNYIFNMVRLIAPSYHGYISSGGNRTVFSYDRVDECLVLQYDSGWTLKIYKDMSENMVNLRFNDDVKTNRSLILNPALIIFVLMYIKLAYDHFYYPELDFIFKYLNSSRDQNPQRKKLKDINYTYVRAIYALREVVNSYDFLTFAGNFKREENNMQTPATEAPTPVSDVVANDAIDKVASSSSVSTEEKTFVDAAITTTPAALEAAVVSNVVEFNNTILNGFNDIKISVLENLRRCLDEDITFIYRTEYVEHTVIPIAPIVVNDVVKVKRKFLYLKTQIKSVNGHLQEEQVEKYIQLQEMPLFISSLMVEISNVHERGNPNHCVRESAPYYDHHYKNMIIKQLQDNVGFVNIYPLQQAVQNAVQFLQAI